MEDNRLLSDAFNIYYEKGIEALRNDNLTVARRNILAAAETLLKLAKNSTGEVKVKRVERAEELKNLADKIQRKQRQLSFSNNANHVAVDAAKFGINGGTSTHSNKSNNQQDEDLTAFAPVKNTGIALDDVAGLDEAKDEIRRLVIEPMRHPEVYAKFNKKRGGGILLYGAPGTGKTMFAQAIATELNAPFYSIKCSDIATKWFGDSEKNIRNLFEQARKDPLAIIFFDEFEALGTKRDSNSTVMKRLVPELLSQIQGFDKSDSTLLIIAATNRPWDIDSAFLRPGRLSTQIYVPLPDEAARRKIIEKNLEGVVLDPSFDIDEVIRITDKFNGSDVAQFCDKLKDPAIERTLQNNNVISPITNNDVELTKQKVHSTVQISDIEKIFKYQQDVLGQR